MRPVPKAYYGFLAGVLIFVGCMGAAVTTGSLWFLVAASIAILVALVELHESMP